MRLLAGVISAAVLTGCASQIYDRPGATNEDLQEALAGCRNKAAMLPVTPNDPTANGLEALGAGLSSYANREQFVQDCLRAQGWVRQR